MCNLTKPNVAGALLLRLTQLVLTWYKATAGDREGHEHVGRDRVTLASPTLWSYTEQKMLCKFSVYSYTEHSITTVLLQYAILYKNGMNIVIFYFRCFYFLRYYIIKYYISCVNWVLKWCTLSIIVIYINSWELTQRGVQSTVWKGRDLFSEDDPKNI